MESQVFCLCYLGSRKDCEKLQFVAKISVPYTSFVYTLCRLGVNMLIWSSYLYGGYGFGEAPAFDDVYILSLPSFTWIKVFSSENPSKIGHGGCSANVGR
jgi:hypothetical protein